MKNNKIKRTYGKLFFQKMENQKNRYHLHSNLSKNNKPEDNLIEKIVLDEIEPHVSIRLKKIFPKIATYATCPYFFDYTPENCIELEWFMQRYPLVISKEDNKKIIQGSQIFSNTQQELDTILLPEYINQNTKTFNEIFIYQNKQPRHYQFQMAEIVSKKGYSLCGDTMGLGKTITGIATIALNISKGLAAVVVPQHLLKQWEEKIKEFTNLTVHIIKKGTPYNLPKADIYLFKYGILSGWTNIFAQEIFHTVIFDEIQELRSGIQTNKGSAAKIVCQHTKVKLGMSGTPIYNYGGEIWHIFDILHENSLGSYNDFSREWCSSLGSNGKLKVNNPEALGQYLRENHLLIRRTKKDVGIEIGKVARIVQTVDYDEKKVASFEELAKQLAITATTGSFIQRGAAARELDMLARQITGIAKAKSIANMARMLIESGEKVILTGWHREVYNIWNNELSDLNPVMYTGSETIVQKEKAKKAFINNETNIMILSNRSGAGLDGLQYVCSTMIIGELDWSPKVHEQLEQRIDRDGQTENIMFLYPVSDSGSDPVIMDLCGLKNSQSNGILDPTLVKDINYGTDESKIKKLIEYYLNK
jgi:SNF2 family DNA or RNA helicase